MTSPKRFRRRLAISMINAIFQNFGKLCSAFFFRKQTLQFVLGSYTQSANRYNNSFVLRHFNTIDSETSIEHVNVPISLKANTTSTQKTQTSKCF